MPLGEGWSEHTQQCLMGTDAAAYPKASGDASLNKNTRWYKRALMFPKLYGYENDQKYTSSDKQCDDTAVIPLILVSDYGSCPKTFKKINFRWKEEKEETCGISKATPF